MEFQQFGWNAVTIGFIGTLVFNVVRIWGSAHQAGNIWRHRSGRSVSVSASVYQFGASGCTFAYGLFIHSAALMINGALTLLLLLPIVVGLGKFKGIGRTGAALLLAMIGLDAAMLALPRKDLIFFAATLGMIAASWLTPWEMWRNKDAGVVEIRMIISNLLNSSFWLIYAVAIGDWVLEFINPCFLASGLVALALWRRYRPSPRGPEAGSGRRT